jgi:peptidoglycan/xylan/chitin deacetylase (PgdA/CDA1 family)
MYLTFDDGPLLGSNNIISILQEEKVKATMFMVGKHVQRSKYRKKTFFRALKEPLILVANHTYSHADGRYKDFYSDTQRVVNDVNKMDDILLENDPNYKFPYCRLAGRNVWRLPVICKNDPGIPAKYCENEKYEALKDAGYHIFGWDYQWAYDPRSGQVYKTPQNVADIIEKIYNRGKTKLKGKFVLLMHDFSFRDKFNGKDQLRTLIQILKDLGWQFETIATYLNRSK